MRTGTEVSADREISSVVCSLPGAIEVFELFGIDCSTAGHLSIADAAELEGIDVIPLVNALRTLVPSSKAKDCRDRSLTELAQSLDERHDHILRHRLGALALDLAEIAAVPSRWSGELRDLRDRIAVLSEQLIEHHRDEQPLFNAVEELETAWLTSGSAPERTSHLAGHVADLLAEHAALSETLQRIRALRILLTDADGIPSRFRAVATDIARLEADLHEMIMLENCIVFPRALSLEDQMLSGVT